MNERDPAYERPEQEPGADPEFREFVVARDLMGQVLDFNRLYPPQEVDWEVAAQKFFEQLQGAGFIEATTEYSFQVLTVFLLEQGWYFNREAATAYLETAQFRIVASSTVAGLEDLYPPESDLALIELSNPDFRLAGYDAYTGVMFINQDRLEQMAVTVGEVLPNTDDVTSDLYEAVVANEAWHVYVAQHYEFDDAAVVSHPAILAESWGRDVTYLHLDEFGSDATSALTNEAGLAMVISLFAAYLTPIDGQWGLVFPEGGRYEYSTMWLFNQLEALLPGGMSSVLDSVAGADDNEARWRVEASRALFLALGENGRSELVARFRAERERVQHIFAAQN